MNEQPYRRTKIVCTLGPASADRATLLAMIQGGMNVARINFSHITGDQFLKYCRLVRECAAQANQEVGILADLQGPKIRIGSFTKGWVRLKEHQSFSLDLNCDPKQGDHERVFVRYPDLPSSVAAGDTLILDDGCIEMQVIEVVGQQVRCEVTTGGVLGSSKGLNRYGGGLSGDSLTEKDIDDMDYAVEAEVDFLAVSFVSTPEELIRARTIYRNQKRGKADIVVKIEKAEVLQYLDQVIAQADAVMVARGDLAIEVGDAALLGIQTRVINASKKHSVPVITATQMMYSMIENPNPTRAEVLDVANAVLDGTDAVCMSNETAVGQHPIRVVNAVNRICLGAEREHSNRDLRDLVQPLVQQVTSADHAEAIAQVAVSLAQTLPVKAIVALTESGATARYISSFSERIPVFGLTRSLMTHRRLTLSRSVYPMNFDVTRYAGDEKTSVDGGVIHFLLEQGLVRKGDCILLTSGSYMGTSGGTNCIKILDIH